MTMISTLTAAPADRFQQLLRELRVAFEAQDVRAIADRIVASEAADFLWEARVREHYLGQDFDTGWCADGDGDELARIVFLSYFRGSWHAGVCLVDGEGRASDLLWSRSFERLDEAEAEFDRAC